MCDAVAHVPDRVNGFVFMVNSDLSKAKGANTFCTNGPLGANCQMLKRVTYFYG